MLHKGCRGVLAVLMPTSLMVMLPMAPPLLLLLVLYMQVHAKSDATRSYLVVLDAAAFAATHQLDLSQVSSTAG